MPDSFAKRRRAEHARRRREEAERIAADAGAPSDLVAQVKAAGGASQLTTLPGETWEEMFEPSVEREQAIADGERSPDEQERFVRALVRKFGARVVEDSPPEEIHRDGEVVESVNNEECALCRRTSTRRTLGSDGRKWCTGSDADSCIRIAQGRLGASGTATGSSRALTGKLRPDGDCRRCGRPIKWVKTQRGKRMPVDVDPAPKGVAAFELVGAVATLAFYISEKKRAVYSGDTYRSHFDTCERPESGG